MKKIKVRDYDGKIKKCTYAIENTINKKVELKNKKIKNIFVLPTVEGLSHNTISRIFKFFADYLKYLDNNKKIFLDHSMKNNISKVGVRGYLKKAGIYEDESKNCQLITDKEFKDILANSTVCYAKLLFYILRVTGM